MTGWERGADGKWRIDLVGSRLDIYGDLRQDKGKPTYKEIKWFENNYHLHAREFRDAENKYGDKFCKEPDAVEKLVGCGAPREWSEKVASILRKANQHGVRKTLEDFIEDDKLFTAYPELKCIEVLRESMPEETQGSYNPYAFLIKINDNITDEVDVGVTLIHEVQHAIQRIEGFVGGNSPKNISLNGVKRLRDYMMFNAISKAEEEDTDAFFNWLEEGGLTDFGLTNDFKHDIQALNKFAEEKKLPEVRNILAEIKEVNDVCVQLEQNASAWDIYHRDMGEVEARDAVRRHFIYGEIAPRLPFALTQSYPFSEQNRLSQLSQECSPASAVKTSSAAMKGLVERKHEAAAVNDNLSSRESENLSLYNDRFNLQVEQYIKGELKASKYFELGYPSGIIKQFLPKLPLIMLQRVMGKGRKKHHLSPNEIRDLPKALANPVMIFKKTPEKIGVLTSLTSSKGQNLFVGIEIASNKLLNGSQIVINNISTVHGRELENIIGPMFENNTLKYIDKKKGLNWLSSAESNLQEITGRNPKDVANLINNFQNPTIKTAESETEFGQHAQKGEGDIRFRVSENWADCTMAAVHNTHPENLRKSLKAGGLINPSIGVIDLNKGMFKSYGKISLLLPSNLLEPGHGNMGIWTGDVFSPSVPATILQPTEKTEKVLEQSLKDLDDNEKRLFKRSFEGYCHTENSDLLAYCFLAKEREASGVSEVFDVVKASLNKIRDLERHYSGYQDRFESFKESFDEEYGLEPVIDADNWIDAEVTNALETRERFKGARATAQTLSDAMNQIKWPIGMSTNPLRSAVPFSLKKLNNKGEAKSEKARLTKSHKDLEDFDSRWVSFFNDLAKKYEAELPTEAISVEHNYQRGEKWYCIDPKRFLDGSYGITLEPDERKKLQEMVDDYQENRPAIYFESKFNRPVQLKEFAAAVVPRETDRDLIEAIEEAGLKIVRYDENSLEDRLAKVSYAARSSEGVLFRLSDIQSDGFTRDEQEAVNSVVANLRNIRIPVEAARRRVRMWPPAAGAAERRFGATLAPLRSAPSLRILRMAAAERRMIRAVQTVRMASREAA